MDKKDIVVVVPIYLTLLSQLEEISLKQCVNVLSEYSIVLVKPESLNVDFVLSCYPQLEVEEFSDECFKSLRSYNKLVLESAFYERFVNYKYMLIYQLDAFVFKDELLYWANQGYDYIGAPWLPWKQRHLSLWGRYRLLCQYVFYRLLDPHKLKTNDKYYYYRVGNGGLSLRSVSKMIEITSHYQDKIRVLLADNKEFYPEDVFLLLELTDSKYTLRKPSFKEALRFSMEENPDWAYKYNQNRLPFGCHNWYRKGFLNFWSQFIDFNQ